MTYELALSILAVAFGAFAAWRAYVPPQNRAVNDLRARVEESEADLADLHGRLNKRSQKANMEKAREAHEERAERRNSIESDAAAIIAAHKAAAGPQGSLLPVGSTPSDIEAARRQLRARHLMGRPL